MAANLDSVAAILAPVTPAAFFAEHHGKRVLHVPGPPEKFAGLMDWPRLNDMLAMEIWSATSLKLVLDRKTLPAEAYCRPTIDRNKQQVMAPRPEQVMAWGRKGATLVLHEVENLVGPIAVANAALEHALGARGMINLYCSWRGRQGFDTHFDKHDVFAFQIVGEKRWRIYENRFENPIEHASFQAIPQSYFDENRGPVAQEILLRPGDLLYLPRGTYHDALAASEASIHLSCGMAEPVGLTWLTAMWELAVEEPLFRATLPRLDGPEEDGAFAAHVDRLTAALRDLAMSERGRERARALRRPPPALLRYDLPGGAEAAAGFVVHGGAARIVRRGAEWVVKADGANHPIGEAEAKLVAWMLARTRFTRAELAADFADQPPERLDRALAALVAAGAVAAG